MTLLVVDQVTRRFGGLIAVNNVSFEVEQGDMVGLIGPNGAGKTTLFALLSGALRPSSGRIVFKGEDVTGWSPDRAAHMGIGRTYQLMRIFGSMSVLENVLVGSYLRERSSSVAIAHARAILRRLGMEDVAERPARTLTVASKKRLELARALATRPALLLLDEVMSGLTPPETAGVIELVRALSRDGITILLVEHVMEVVMGLSTRVIVLDHGIRIAEGPPDVIARDQAVIAAYLGLDDGAA